MPIVSSQVVEDAPQPDGRRFVTERHVDHVGLVHFVRYMAERLTDAAAIMAARVSAFEAQQKQREIDREIQRVLEDGPAVMPNLRWNTNTEFGLALRDVFRESRRGDALRIGWWVNSFGLTDNQLRAFFGLSVPQVATVRAKLIDLAAKYDAMQSAEGA